MSYTTKAVSANAQKNNGGVLAFVNTPSGPITGSMGKTLLNVTQTRDNLPVSSGVAGFFGHGVTTAVSTAALAYWNTSFLFRGLPYSLHGVTSLKNKGITTGAIKPLSVHTRTTRKIRVITGWDYVTGAAEGVSVVDADFGRDDAIPSTKRGEFVYIPAGGRLPSQAAGNAKYYTYVKLY